MVDKIVRDLEVGHLSKEESQKKWRKQRELAAKLKAYEVKARAEIEAEENQETPVEVVEEVVKEVPKTTKAKSKK